MAPGEAAPPAIPPAGSPADDFAIEQRARDMREAGLFDEADALLAPLVPRRLEACIEYALVAHGRKDHAASLARWETVRSRDPSHISGYTGAIATLWELKRYEEGDALLAIGQQTAPSETMAYTYAWSATLCRNWEEALRRWRPIRIAKPDDIGALVCLGRALIALGLYEDWRHEVLPTALLHPDRADLYEQVAHVGSNVGSHVGSHVGSRAGSAVESRPVPRPPGGGSLGDLCARFEALGDNCEFGLVQRHFGVEPLGLLRWADITVEGIVRALDRRFAGIGDDIDFVPGGPNYFLRDNSFGTVLHTFVPVADVPEEIFAVRMRKRLKFLADKLLDDLEDGEKLFLYKPRDGAFSDDEVARVVAAFRRLSSGRLLCIRLDPERHRARPFEEIEPDLAMGFLDHVSPQAADGDISFDSWERLLREAARHWD